VTVVSLATETVGATTYTAITGIVANPSVSGATVTVTRSSGADTVALQTHRLRFSGVKNQPDTAVAVAMNVKTTTNADVDIDTATSGDSGLNLAINTFYALNSASITLDRVEKSASGFVDVTFTQAGGTFASTGAVRIWFPAGFSFPGTTAARTATWVNASGLDGTLTPGAPVTPDNYIDVARTAGTNTGASGTSYVLRLTNIQNPSTAGTTDPFSVLTYPSSTGSPPAATGTKTAQVLTGVTVTVSSSSAINGATVTPQYAYRQATGYVSIQFATVTAIPADGKVVVTLPSGFAIPSSMTCSTASGATCVTSVVASPAVSIAGNFNVAVSGQVVTVTRANDGAVTTGGQTHLLRFAGVITPNVAGATASFSIQTQSGAAAALDQVLSGVTTTIAAAGLFPAVSVAPTRLEYGAIGPVAVTFTSLTAHPSTGMIRITLPGAFSIAGVASFSASSGDISGSLTAAGNGSAVTVNRTGTASTAAAGGSYSLTVNSIKNPSSAGAVSGFLVETLDIYGSVLDTSAPIALSVTIAATGALNGVQFLLASATTSTLTYATVGFTTTQAIPTNGKIVVVFPATFSFPADSRRAARQVSYLSGGAYTVPGGALTFAVLGTTVTATRTGGSIIAAGTTIGLQITNVMNPVVTGATSSLRVTTQTAAGATLDDISTGVTFTISQCPDSCSGVGSCVNGTCLCSPGRFGANCAGEVTTGYMAYDTQSAYSIDWDTVPTVQETQPVFTENKLTEGVCSCDLTRNLCDALCCCDTDCSTAQVALFKTTSTSYECAAQRNVTNKPMTCIVTSTSGVKQDRGGLFTLAYFNPASGMKYFVPSATSRELCVETDNNPSDGYFYTDRGALSATETFAIVKAYTHAAFSFGIQASFDEPVLASLRIEGRYMVGDRVPAIYSGLAGYLRLPAAGLDGGCTGESYAEFLVPKRNQTCMRRTASLASECATAYDARGQVHNVQVRTRFATTGLTHTYVTVFTNNTGTGLAWPPPQPTWNSGTQTCENALLGLQWEVTHSDAGAISAVSVVVSLGSVKAAEDGSSSTNQAYDIQFIRAGETSSLKSRRSGNIGYTPGGAVLAGTQMYDGSKTAVSQAINGLAVPAPGVAGKCDGREATVAFGASMQSCCTVDLTIGELEARCAGARSGGLGYGVQSSLNSSTLIGVYGGSDINVLADWLSLPAATAPASDAEFLNRTGYNTLGYGYNASQWDGVSATSWTVWDSNTKTCYGLTGGIHLQFTYALEGAYKGPSRRITRVSQEYTRASWGWDEDSVNGDGTQSFPVCYTVHFAEQSTLVRNAPATLVSRVLFYPVLGIFDDWGMESGVVTFFAAIYCAVPCLAAIWLVTSPVSFTRRILTSLNE